MDLMEQSSARNVFSGDEGGIAGRNVSSENVEKAAGKRKARKDLFISLGLITYSLTDVFVRTQFE